MLHNSDDDTTRVTPTRLVAPSPKIGGLANCGLSVSSYFPQISRSLSMAKSK